MKKTLFLILFFLVNKSFCQQSFNVKYNYTVIAEKINVTTQVKSYLIGNGNKSIYEEDFMQKNETTTNENTFSIKQKQNPIFYKDLNKNIIIYNDHISLKPFDIKDSIPQFDWQIVDEEKVILGYKCQKANLLFRGLKYVVFFTPEIPYSDGPWKFSGLPGLILEVNSKNSDYSYRIIAEKFEFKENRIENPYLNKSLINHKEFTEIYKKKHKESMANQLQNPGSFIMPKGYREIYVVD